MRTSKILLPLTLGLLAAFALIWVSAQAAVNQSPTAGRAIIDVCAACPYSSIQAAIDDADEYDTINLYGETFTETITVDKSLTIQGAGMENTIIQAANAPEIAGKRVVTVTEGVTVTMQDLTIRYGDAVGTVSVGNGGGILNQGNLTIDQTRVYSNTANYYGGGIYNDGYYREVSLKITNSEVISNSAYQGGGIENYAFQYSGDATAVISNTRIEKNTVSQRGAGVYNHTSFSTASMTITQSSINDNKTDSGSGGGVYNSGGSENGRASLEISDSAISGNEAMVSAGGIFNESTAQGTALLNLSRCTLDDNTTMQGGGIINKGTTTSTATTSVKFSTISNNTATGPVGGGGIINEGSTNSTVTMEIENSTISHNFGAYGGGAYNKGHTGATATMNIKFSTFSENWSTSYGSGGGVRNLDGTMNLFGTIIANSPSGFNCANSGSGSINDNGANLADDTSCGFFLVGDPKLAPLADNGGPTWTHAVQTGSRALDTIHQSVCTVATDQRGVLRPQDSYCEIGAYEAVSEAWVDDDWEDQEDVDAYDPDLTWGANAFDKIGDAVAAVLSSTVHVLAGTYTESLTLDKSVEIIGENGAANTILQAANTPGTASSRVITVTSGVTVTIEGLTIRHGFAQGSTPDDSGGGILNNGVLTITNSIVTGNRAANSGGGIVNNGSNGSATLNIHQSTVSDNVGVNYGGGITNYSNNGNARINISESTIFNNQAPQGGGILNTGNSGDSRMLISYSTVISNSASSFAGGIYNYGVDGQVVMTLTHSSVLSNTADTYAGGMYNNDAEVNIDQSTFSANTAGTYGGAMHNKDSVLKMDHSTIYTNTATNNFGGIRAANSNVTLSNNILAHNQPDDCSMAVTTNYTDTGYNLVQNGSFCIAAGSSFSDDPELDPLEDNGGALTGVAGDPTLTHAPQADSPALDRIPPGSCSATDDQRGFTRPDSAGCDIGAIEAIQEVWVDDDWTDQDDVDAYNPALIWGTNAFSTVAEGIDAVVGSTVHVLTGTYTERLTVDKSVEVIGEAGAANTIIQAASSEGVATSRVFTIARGVTVTLEGLSIRHGVAEGSGEERYGGGIFNQGVLSITNSLVYSNSAHLRGGGIYNDGSYGAYAAIHISQSAISDNQVQKGGGIFLNAYSGSAVASISDSTITNNSATGDGGGIYLDGDGSQLCTLDINRSTFEFNTAGSAGGGLMNISGSSADVIVTISQSTFNDNEADGGAGIYHLAGGGSNKGTLNITQSTFSSNVASDNGGGIRIDGGVNNAIVSTSFTTFWGNSAEQDGGGIYNTGTFTLENSIVAGSPEGGDCYYTGGSPITDNGYNLVEDGSCLSDPTSISGDPVLGSLQDNGGETLTHALLPGSPVIDFVPGPECTANFDQRGVNRPFGPGCDSGAFEMNTFSTSVKKSVDDDTPEPGQTINFTIVLHNDGPAIKGLVFSDTLQSGLNFVGPISLDPPEAGTVGDEPPTLATTGNISANQRITVTFPVSVSLGIPSGTVIQNTVRLTNLPGFVVDEDTVVLIVANVPPVAEDDSGVNFTTDEDSAFATGNVLDNDSDINNDTLSLSSIDTSGTKGVVTDLGDGTFSYDPDDQFEGLAVGESDTDSFGYTISDGKGGSDTATVTITINGVNDDPSAADDSGIGFNTAEDTPFTTRNVLDNDSDPDGDTLSVTAIDTSTTKGQVTDLSDGTFEYDPSGQFEALAEGESDTDTYTYTISDGNGGSDTATVIITITGVTPEPEGYVIYLPMVRR